MNRPEDIPVDIWHAAWEAIGAPDVRVHRSSHFAALRLVSAAIVAERERCAKIADAYAHRDTGREIADAIRLPTPPHTGKE